MKLKTKITQKKKNLYTNHGSQMIRLEETMVWCSAKMRPQLIRLEER